MRIVFKFFISMAVMLLIACVNPNTSSNSSVENITISGGTSFYLDSDSVSLTAIVTTSGGASTAVTWEVTAGSGNITGAGVVTISGPGSITVKATSISDSSKSASLTINFNDSKLIGTWNWSLTNITINSDGTYLWSDDLGSFNDTWHTSNGIFYLGENAATNYNSSQFVYYSHTYIKT